MTHVQGAYQLQVFNGSELVEDTGEFRNLITNEALTQGNPFSNGLLAVGADTVVEPAYDDTDLKNEIAAVSSTFDSSGVIVMNQGRRYAKRSVTATFTGINGNISEVGFRKAEAGSLVSRSLIRDGNGLVTVVPVEAQQTLKLTYSIYVLIPDILAEGTVETPYGSSRFWIKPHPGLVSPAGILAGYFDQPFTGNSLRAKLQSGAVNSTIFQWSYDAASRTATGVANFAAVAANRTITGFESASNTANLPIIELETPLLNPANSDIDFVLEFSWGRE